MGQSTPTLTHETAYDAKCWISAVEESNTTRFDQVNPYRKGLYLNRHMVDIVQSYQLTFKDRNEFAQYILKYRERKQLTRKGNQNETLATSPFIYQVRYLRDTTQNQLCSSHYKGLLFVDKVDLRLKEVNDIPFQDQVYLYRACLQGFKLLYENYGAFDIREDMIFFSQQGKVRVWSNPDLSKFQPNYDPETYNSVDYLTKSSQAEMIRGLINAIEHNSDPYPNPRIQTFVDYLTSQNGIDKLTFTKAIQYFEAYVHQNSIKVGNFMYSIYSLFNNTDNCVLEKSQVERASSDQPSPLNGYLHPPRGSFSRKLPNVEEKSCDKENSSKVSCKQELRRSTSFKRVINFTSNGKIYAGDRDQLNNFDGFDIKRPERTKSFDGFPFESIKSPPFDDKVLGLSPLSARDRSPMAVQRHQPVIMNIQTEGSQYKDKSLIDKLKTPTQTTQFQFSKENPIKNNESLSTNTKISIKNKLNYFSETEQYEIDDQIAEDIVKYLKVDLKHF